MSACPESVCDEVRPAERRRAQLEDVHTRGRKKDVRQTRSVSANYEACILCSVYLQRESTGSQGGATRKKNSRDTWK
jgi:hypothetical protein